MRRQTLSSKLPPVTSKRPVAELYRKYRKRLYRFGVQALGDSGLAAEMVQECLVRSRWTAERFDATQGSVGDYLFGLQSAPGSASSAGSADHWVVSCAVPEFPVLP